MNILQKLFFRLVPAEILQGHLDLLAINTCKSKVEVHHDSRFYAEARVSNFQGIRNKIRIAKSTHIRGELLLFPSGGEITIGEGCYIGEGSRIWSASKVEIGNHVLISHNCNLIDTDSHELDHLERAESYLKMLKSGHSKENKNVRTSPIIIGDYAWLSYNVSILKGITIGKGAIVAAGSVVTSNVPPFCIVAGNPAKVIQTIENKQ